MNATILALDISSVAIGWVIYDGLVHDYGEIVLKHADINHRCRLARAGVELILANHPSIDAVAIEAPGGQFKGTVIPQCFVSGAIRSYIAELNIPICDVAAQHAKKALTGKGNADKALMQRAAQAYQITGEHASDALGVALTAAGRVQVVEERAA